jgi:hypothetical protein
MILILHGPGTTRVISRVSTVHGAVLEDNSELVLDGKTIDQFIDDKPFGWFCEDRPIGFGTFPEFFRRRFTHILLLNGPTNSKWNWGKTFWLLKPEEKK